MTSDQCWQIVNLARAAASQDVAAQADRIERHLATLTPAEIVGFQQWLLTKMEEANRSEVFTAVNWIDAASGVSEISGDTWEYHRAWLVGLGQADFDAVLGDPDLLADHFTHIDDFLAGEAIKLAAHRAYGRATGLIEVPDEMYEPSAIERFPSDPMKLENRSEILQSRFPKLTRRFGPPKFA